MEKDNTENFTAVLTPYRSLGRRGFVILMSILIALNFAAGSAFFAIGAWPVAPFMGLDVLLVWWAFRLNYVDAKRAERIEITPHELILDRMGPDGKAEQKRFTRGWVQVDLERDEARDLIGRLFLRSHGAATEIGRFLSAEDRQAFAKVLSARLAKKRI
jgi:uncharacterized membrane protein